MRTCRWRRWPARPACSPRQFARAFAAEMGIPPGRYVDRVRLETARRRLEDTADGVEQTARSCGYGTPEAMRRAFVALLGVTPGEYRRRFRPAAVSTEQPQLRKNQCRSPSCCSTGFTALDAIGPYQVLSRLPGAEVSFVAERPGPIGTRTGSLVVTDRPRFADVPVRTSSWCPAVRARTLQMQDGPVLEWLRPPTGDRPGPRRSAPAR